MSIGAPSSVNIKLLLLGNTSVGKSCLLSRLFDEPWKSEDEATPTIGVDFRVHRMVISGKRVSLNIWDTSGQERFRTVTSSHYRGTQGIILVYDVTRRETYDALPGWIAEIDTRLSTTVPKIIVGNKLDKEHSRQVSTEEASAFAELQNVLFLEASAKTAVGVRKMFEDLVGEILNRPELWEPVTPTTGVADGSTGKVKLRSDSGRKNNRRCTCSS